MSQSMIIEALDTFFPKNKEKFRFFLKADCSENDLIDIMKQVPDEIDFSSLPHLEGDKRTVVISVGSYEKDKAENYFKLFVDLLNKQNIKFVLEDK